MAQRLFRVCVCRTTDEQEHILMFLDTTEEETEHVSVEHERRGWGWGWLDLGSGDEVHYSYRGAMIQEHLEDEGAR